MQRSRRPNWSAAQRNLVPFCSGLASTIEPGLAGSSGGADTIDGSNLLRASTCTSNLSMLAAQYLGR